ncbi:hypothetical protein LJ739_08790 [Aestuariibacter halophilus]|uniref:Uncharacterized protein n=1 Tax=Fluctibacter halophilus TaxID=226011 RepID=A0ABS8G942_9ALTE|nr:hypothetical protein [Aestuariibacter halophilus]MCC2616335.1 hypothetical protein [Aestuariibacter halophilus]
MSTCNIHISTSSNAMCVEFEGIQDGLATAKYVEEVARFCDGMNDKPWARIIDLRQWVLTIPESNQAMIASLREDGQNGLVLEAIIPPITSLGRWQVEKTMASVASDTRFEFVASIDEAKTLLQEQGFDTDFGPSTMFIS